MRSHHKSYLVTVGISFQQHLLGLVVVQRSTFNVIAESKLRTRRDTEIQTHDIDETLKAITPKLQFQLHVYIQS